MPGRGRIWPRRSHPCGEVPCFSTIAGYGRFSGILSKVNSKQNDRLVTPTSTSISTHAERLRRLTARRLDILAMPPDEAVAAILEHPQPAALVHSFPEEDLHFLIHDIGFDEATPLIRLASNRQWEYMLDMETWHGDQLDYPSVTTWLRLLLDSDPQRLVRWCFAERLEFLELYLFRNIELRVREDDQAPSDFGDGFFSDDDTFYVRIVDYPVATPAEEAARKQRNDMLYRLLRRLSESDHPRYQGLLLESVGVLPAEAEEELFRLRNVRLAEKGFLPFHEAVGVYQPLRPAEMRTRGTKVVRPASPDDARLPVPPLAAGFLDQDNLFVRALKGIDAPHVHQQLQVELAALCNQVISADREIVRGREQLRAVVTKVSGYLAIGLERLTDAGANRRELRASLLIRRHLLADIFRTGAALVMQLKWRAEHWRRTSWCRSQGEHLTFWGESWLGLLGGLLLDRPKFYEPSSSGARYREFKTQADVVEADRALGQLTALDHLLAQMARPMPTVAEFSFLTYKNLLLTLWARSILELPATDAGVAAISIPLADFKKFYAALWATRRGRRTIAGAQKTAFLNWAAHASRQAPGDLSDRLGSVFEALFDEIESEMATVSPTALDPRHIHLFLLH